MTKVQKTCKHPNTSIELECEETSYHNGDVMYQLFKCHRCGLFKEYRSSREGWFVGDLDKLIQQRKA